MLQRQGERFVRKIKINNNIMYDALQILANTNYVTKELNQLVS